MGLLDLFKEQLENETNAIAEQRGLQQRGSHLIWWYFQKLVGISDSEIEDIVTDGYSDHGIDAIRIDDENVVHFYSFKNPHKIADAFPSKDVDSLLAGLNLLIQNQLDAGGANPALRLRAAEVRRVVATGYRIHLVTSGTGLNQDATVKLDGFISRLDAPSADFCTWKLEDIQVLQAAFYARTRPAVADPLTVPLTAPPYVVRAAGHDCYMFSLPGQTLANLFAEHGEELLQQNIRVGQGDRSTNALIKQTATSDESGNFLHYNNGVVFLAEEAAWDYFKSSVVIRQYQIVNGGQTVRMLHSASEAGALRDDVVVPVRVTTSGADKAFANNVAVNLNNQNKVENSFLRSNDPQVVQLQSALASEGWYLERRENDVEILTPAAKAAWTAKFSAPLEERVIGLTSGIQAYVATYMHEPELAKRYWKSIFVAASENGNFERVFSSNLTATKIIVAHRVWSAIARFVTRFGSLKRRKTKSDDWRAEYGSLLGTELVEKHGAILDVVIPPSSIFLTAVVFSDWCDVQKLAPNDLVDRLEGGDTSILSEAIMNIIDAHASLSDARNWPTRLKSDAAFNGVMRHIRGKRTEDRA